MRMFNRFLTDKRVIAGILLLTIAVTMPAMYAQELPTTATVMAELKDGTYPGIPIIPSDKALANYEKSKEIANSLVESEKDNYEKAKKLFKWAISKTTYDDDGRNDKIGEHNLHENGYRGVCNDFAELLCELYWTQNIPAVHIEGYADFGTTKGSHAWVAFYANDEWHWADPTRRDMKYFDISDEIMDEQYQGQCANMCVRKNAWAIPAIQKAMQSGLLDIHFLKDSVNTARGYVTFKDPCSRLGFAQLAVNLLEVSGIDTDVSVDKSKFTDTQDMDVLIANALGCVSGNPDGTFNPDGEITRQEAASILARTAKVLGVNASSDVSELSDFTDADSISNWAKESVAFCVNAGIMSGTSNTTFSPNDVYTREQCIATIVRLFEV